MDHDDIEAIYRRRMEVIPGHKGNFKEFRAGYLAGLDAVPPGYTQVVNGKLSGPVTLDNGSVLAAGTEIITWARTSNDSERHHRH